MTIYACILGWIIIVSMLFRPISWIDEYNEFRVRVTNAKVLCTMGVVVFFIGLRSAGADTHAYIKSFNQLPYGWQRLFDRASYAGNSEYLFEAFGIVCKTLHNDYHFYLFCIAAVTGFFVAVSLNYYSDYYDLGMILFMLMGTYSWMINGIREFLAVSIVFAGSRYISRRNIFKFALFVLIAMLVHNSAIIMFPMYFVVNGKAWNKRTVLFLLLGIVSILFVGRFISALEQITQGTVYEGYTQQFLEDDGSSFLRTMVYAVPVLMSWLKRKQISEIASPFIHMSINMSILCVAVSLIANFTSGVLIGRIPIYFSMFNLVLLPWLINAVYLEQKQVLTCLMISFYMIYALKTCNLYYYSDLLFGGYTFPRW